MSSNGEQNSDSSGEIRVPDYDVEEINAFIDPEMSDAFMIEHPEASQMLMRLTHQLHINKVHWEDVFNPDNIALENQIQQLRLEEQTILKKQDRLLRQVEGLSNLKRDLLKQAEGIQHIKEVAEQGRSQAEKEHAVEIQKLIQIFKQKEEGVQQVFQQIQGEEKSERKERELEAGELNKALEMISKFREAEQERHQKLLAEKRRLQETVAKEEESRLERARAEQERYWREAEKVLGFQISEKKRYLKKLKEYNQMKGKEKRGKGQEDSKISNHQRGEEKETANRAVYE